MMARCTLAAGLLAVIAAGQASAQDRARDSSWVISFDDPSVVDSSLFLVVMRPGWHVTTPAESGVTLLQPDSVAGGSFVLKSVIFAFNADASPYGLVLGAKEEGASAQEYLTFLLNNDGTFGVFHRAGTEVHTTVPWTPSDAIVRKVESARGTAKNVVSVLAGADMVRFYINGTEVTRQARQWLNMDGTIGLRVEQGTNLHVSELTVAALGTER